MGIKLALVIAGGIVAVAVGMLIMKFQARVPDWAEERSKQMMVAAVFELSTLLAYPVSWLNGVHYLKALRSVMSYVHPTKYLDSPTMKVSRTHLDGVAAKMFRPLSTPDSYSPALVYLHGGGWSIFEADQYDDSCYIMALKLNIVVISIDYRQAPDHPYPVPFEDCVRATVHVMREAKSMGIDPQRVAIAGDSAGGNLAAAVSLRLSQEDLASTLPPLKFQVLIYPAVQMLDLNTPSYTNFSNKGLLSKHSAIRMMLGYVGDPDLAQNQAKVEVNGHSSDILQDPLIASYLNYSRLPRRQKLSNVEPVRAESENVLKLSPETKSVFLDPYFAPLLARHLSRVPPAYLIIANIDILRDDGLLYAERLREAGVATEVDFYPGMPHGFFTFHFDENMAFDRAWEALDKLALYIKEHL